MRLMRQIEPDVKREWDSIKKPPNNNLASEDCESNMLTGWTDKNPSVWDISEGKNKPNLKAILIALCRRKKDWEKIAYLIFKKAALDKAKVILEPTNGNTGDQRIDVSNTHYELKNITGKQLCSLIYYIISDEFETGLFKKSEYDKIVLEAYDKHYLSISSESSTYRKPPAELSGSGSLGDKKIAEKTPEIIQDEEQTKTIASSSTAD